MKLDLSQTVYDARWYDFATGASVEKPEPPADDPERVFLKIRPYPGSSTVSIFDPQKGVVYDGKEICRRFKFCLMDWHNVHDAAGKKAACTDEIKQMVFDFNMGGIVPFSTRIIQQLDGYLRGLEKN